MEGRAYWLFLLIFISLALFTYSFSAQGQLESCQSGQTRPCGSIIGTCSPGIRQCVNGDWGACTGAILPSPELCDKTDNDCNGIVDDKIICECFEGETRPCGSSVGACKPGLRTCSAGKWGQCTGGISPSEEICDSIDNNCNGFTDEICLSPPPVTPKITIEPRVEEELNNFGGSRVIVRLKSGRTISSKLLESKNVRNFQSGILTKETFEKLKSDDAIEEIIIDQRVSLLINDSLSLIRADLAHNLSVNGSGVKICLIDSGVDYNHPAIRNYAYGYDFINNDNDPLDDNGHGTAVAGIISAVAPGSQLIVAKVLDNNGIGYESNVLQGLDYCISQNVSIISLSIGTGAYSGFCDTNIMANLSNEAVSRGIFVAAATGNDGSNQLKSPSCASRVFRVAATDKNDSVAAFSNINKITDLLAPGVDIQTTSLNNSYANLSGTSLSIPFVTGAAALVLQKEFLNPEQLKFRLRSTGKVIIHNNLSYARLDVYNAVTNNVTNIPRDYTAEETQEPPGGTITGLITCGLGSGGTEIPACSICDTNQCDTISGNCASCSGATYSETILWASSFPANPCCCGDDSNEFYLNQTTTFACCDQPTDCVNTTGSCFDNSTCGTSDVGSGFNVANYCNNKTWVNRDTSQVACEDSTGCTVTGVWFGSASGSTNFRNCCGDDGIADTFNGSTTGTNNVGCCCSGTSVSDGAYCAGSFLLLPRTWCVDGIFCGNDTWDPNPSGGFGGNDVACNCQTIPLVFPLGGQLCESFGDGNNALPDGVCADKSAGVGVFDCIQGEVCATPDPAYYDGCSLCYFSNSVKGRECDASVSKGECIGTPHTCASLGSTQCIDELADGCTWTGSECRETHNACNTYNSSQSVCGNHGCTWVLNSTGYIKDGICVYNTSTTSSCDNVGHACYNGIDYFSNCSSCSQGATCDTNIADGIFNSTGPQSGTCLVPNTEPALCCATGQAYVDTDEDGFAEACGCSAAYKGLPCDSDGGTFQQDGVCQGNICDALTAIYNFSGTTFPSSLHRGFERATSSGTSMPPFDFGGGTQFTSQQYADGATDNSVYATITAVTLTANDFVIAQHNFEFKIRQTVSYIRRMNFTYGGYYSEIGVVSITALAEVNKTAGVNQPIGNITTTDSNITFTTTSNFGTYINGSNYTRIRGYVRGRASGGGLHFVTINTDYIEVRVKYLPTKPKWANPAESPAEPVNYSKGQSYQFSVTWSDDTSDINTVIIEHNFTGTFQNYTVTSYTGTNPRIYTYTWTDIATGFYGWRMYANNSDGYANVTDRFNYTVNKSINPISMYINNRLNQNVTISLGTPSNVTAYDSGGFVLASLTKEGVGVSNPHIATLGLGTHQYRGNSTGNANYTGNITGAQFNLSVVPNNPPVVTLMSPPDNYTTKAIVVNFTCYVTDAFPINNVSLYTNFSGNWTIFDTNYSGLIDTNYTFAVDLGFFKMNDTFNLTDLIKNNPGDLGLLFLNGITTNGTDFWIVKSKATASSRFVFHINSSGHNQTDGFSVSNIGNPYGITMNRTNLWLTSLSNPTVYMYDKAGNLVTQFNTGITTSYGITTNGTDFWIIDNRRNVTHVNSAGVNMTDGFDATVVSGSVSPVGIVSDVELTGGKPTRFWILDEGKKAVQLVNYSGNLIKEYNISKFFNNMVLRDITTRNGTDFWINDGNNSNNFTYHAAKIIPGTYRWNCQAVDSSFASSFSSNNRTITVVLNRLPTHDPPLIIPYPTFFGNNITCLNQSTLDLDGELVTNIYNWKVDNIPFAVVNMPFEINVSVFNATVLDYSGYKNNGTLGNLPGYLFSGPGAVPSWRNSTECKIGGCYYFNGMNLISIPNSPSLSTVGQKDYTFEVWVRLAELGESHTISQKGSQTGGSPSPWSIGVGGNNKIFFRVYNGSSGTGNPGLLSATALDTNWHHMVAIRNSSGYLQMYIDGLMDNSTQDTTWPQSLANTASTCLGDRCVSVAIFMNGSLDQPLIYNKTLTPQEIQAHYLLEYNKIVSEETRGLQNWTCEVTPSDGIDDGITKSNSTVIIDLTTSLSKIIQPDTVIAGSNETINVTVILRVNRTTENITTINISDEIPYDFTPPQISAVKVIFEDYNPYRLVDITNNVTITITDRSGLLSTWLNVTTANLSNTDAQTYMQVNDSIRIEYLMSSSQMGANESRTISTNSTVFSINNNSAKAGITKTINSSQVVLRGTKRIFNQNLSNPQELTVEINLKALGGPLSNLSLTDYLPSGAVVRDINVTYYNNTNKVTRILFNGTDYTFDNSTKTILPDGTYVDIWYYNFSYACTNWDCNLYNNDSITIKYNVTVLGGGQWILPTIIAGYDPSYNKHIKTEMYAQANVPSFDVSIETITATVAQGDTVKALLKMINVGGPRAKVDVHSIYSIKTADGELITERSETFAVVDTKEKELELRLPQTIEPGQYNFEVFVTYTGREAVSTDTFEVRGLSIKKGEEAIQSFDILIYAIVAILVVILFVMFIILRKIY